MKQSGACVADKDIKQRFKFNKNITDNIDSELRFDYGEEYWHLMERLGKSADFPIELWVFFVVLQSQSLYQFLFYIYVYDEKR